MASEVPELGHLLKDVSSSGSVSAVEQLQAERSSRAPRQRSASGLLLGMASVATLLCERGLLWAPDGSSGSGHHHRRGGILLGRGIESSVVSLADATQLEGGVLAEVAATKPVLKVREGHPCLCLFDIDRTLTGMQGAEAQCTGNERIADVHDTAFDGGELVLSPLGRHLNQTFCEGCSRGIISAGDASGAGSAERVVLGKLFPEASLGWSHRGWDNRTRIHSPLVIGCYNAEKADCAEEIVDWFLVNKHIKFKPRDVYFFDDKFGNIDAFARFGYNARTISCASRDPEWKDIVGLCGAQLSEITPDPGLHLCPV